MGFVWDGVCYQDGASALDAFAKSMVQGNPTGITSFSSAPTISTQGVVTWSITHRPLTTTATTIRTGTTQLSSCTPAAMDQWPLADQFFIAALFFAAFLGFRTGFRP